jgi:hypothetical protein
MGKINKSMMLGMNKREQLLCKGRGRKGKRERESKKE